MICYPWKYVAHFKMAECVLVVVLQNYNTSQTVSFGSWMKAPSALAKRYQNTSNPVYCLKTKQNNHISTLLYTWLQSNVCLLQYPGTHQLVSIPNTYSVTLSAALCAQFASKNNIWDVSEHVARTLICVRQKANRVWMKRRTFSILLL